MRRPGRGAAVPIERPSSKRGRAAGIESIAGYCLGCQAFGLPIRFGLVPDTVCAECAEIRLRREPFS